MDRKAWLTFAKEYLLIFIGSIFYAASTVLFIFPGSLLLGGTSGLSVILNAFLPFSPGTILMIINFGLIILAFFVLGKDMGVKTLVGSVFTTLFVGVFEKIFLFSQPLITNPYLAVSVGASVIASSSGGTDVIALIIKKFFGLQIGRALLVTDVLIVILGGIVSGWTVLFASFLGLLVKTFGVDFVISKISKLKT